MIETRYEEKDRKKKSGRKRNGEVKILVIAPGAAGNQKVPINNDKIDIYLSKHNMCRHDPDTVI